MPSPILTSQAQSYSRPVPPIKPGFTVRIHERIQEGSKERVQVFEGLVISVHNGHVPTDRGFTVRRVVSGVGVEKTFALFSPNLEKIEVKKVAKTRRAKLYFLRGRAGKSARMIERYTSAEEFGVPAQPEAAKADKAEEAPVEAPAAEETTAEAPAVQAAAPAADAKTDAA